MNIRYYFDILVSAQVNRYNFLVVYEPYRVLEGLKGVGFQGKNYFKKWPQTSPKLILALYNMKKWKKKYYYDILVSAWVNVELMGESTRLVCVQLQERDFEKKIFTKSDGDFQQLLCEKHFQRDVHCAKKYFDDILVFAYSAK